MTDDEIEAKAREIAHDKLVCPGGWPTKSGHSHQCDYWTSVITAALREQAEAHATEIEAQRQGSYFLSGEIAKLNAQLVEQAEAHATALRFQAGAHRIALTVQAEAQQTELDRVSRLGIAALRAGKVYDKTDEHDWRKGAENATKAREARLVALLREARPWLDKTVPETTPNMDALVLRIDAELGGEPRDE